MVPGSHLVSYCKTALINVSTTLCDLRYYRRSVWFEKGVAIWRNRYRLMPAERPQASRFRAIPRDVQVCPLLTSYPLH